MSKEEIYEQLNGIFRKTFMDDSIELKPETCSADIEDWGSLMQILLLSEIERKFMFKFESKEINNMQNVGEMVDIINGKLG